MEGNYIPKHHLWLSSHRLMEVSQATTSLVLYSFLQICLGLMLKAFFFLQLFLYVEGESNKKSKPEQDAKGIRMDA